MSPVHVAMRLLVKIYNLVFAIFLYIWKIYLIFSLYVAFKMPIHLFTDLLLVFFIKGTTEFVRY